MELLKAIPVVGGWLSGGGNGGGSGSRGSTGMGNGAGERAAPHSAPVSRYPTPRPPPTPGTDDPAGHVLYKGRFLKDMPVSQLGRILKTEFGVHVSVDALRGELIRILAREVEKNAGALASEEPPPFASPSAKRDRDPEHESAPVQPEGTRVFRLQFLDIF